MTLDLTASVVRILKSDGNTSGAGFLLSEDGLIATCAHVIQALKNGAQDKPIRVDVIFYGTSQKRAAVLEPDFWRDLAKEDLAILRLEGDLPAEAKPVLLGSSFGTSGHKFKTFGFPDARSVEGIWGYGIIGDHVPDLSGKSLLQLTGSTEVTPGFSGAPVLDTTTSRVVGMVTSILAPDRFGRLSETAFITPSEVLRDVCPLLQVSDICPYLGLSSFTEMDAGLFFGRQKVLDRLLESLHCEPGFLAVLGPSGSGKSSVVQAKLIPALRKGQLPGSDKWDILSIRRSDKPFYSLEEQGLKVSQGDLGEAVKAWLDQHKDKTRLVLVLDQFEEFLLAHSSGIDETFPKQLKMLLSSPLPVTVILVMRDDFYSSFVKQIPELMEWVERGLVNVPSTLDKQELIDIIQEPAKAVGLKFETGLVDVILSDVLKADITRDASGGTGRSTILPLLEFALTELWHRRADGLLTHEAYSSIGGVAGGLTTRAEAALLNLDDKMRLLARCIFTGLVRLSVLPGTFDSRQRRPLERLCVIENDRDLVRRTVDKLADERLLITFLDQENGQEIVDIIHEALIREWGRLRQWLNEDHRFLLWIQEAEAKAKAWAETFPTDSSKRDEGRLLRGRDLAEAEGWLNERGTELNSDIREYIQTSVDLNLKERRREKRRTKILAIAFIIALSLAIVAGYYWQETAKQKDISISNQLAAQSELIRNQQASRLPLSIALAVESINRHDSPEAEDILRRGLSLLHKRKLDVKHNDIVYAVAFSPDGKYFATASADKTAKLWNASTGKEITSINHSDVVWDVAFSPDSRFLATASSDRTAIIYDISNGHNFRRIAHNGTVWDVEFSPNSTYLATASSDNTTKLLNLDTGVIITLDHNGVINRVSFSPNGRYLATASDDGTAKIWSVLDGKLIGQVKHEDIVQSVCFNKDSTLFATASWDKTAALWYTLNRSNKFIFYHNNFVNDVSFSPNGNFIATGSYDKTARIWDVARGVEISRMSHEDGIRRIAFSPNGEQLATASFDNTGRLWFVPSGGEVGIMPHNDSVNSVAFSPDGKYLASASNDKIVAIWDTLDEREVMHFNHQDVISKLAFSPDGKYLATASDDKTVALLDLTTNKKLLQIYHSEPVNDVSFSPDGKYLATASDDKTARVWDINNSKEIFKLIHDGPVWSVNFSPDSKYIVTASDDKTARLWIVNTGQEVAKMIHRDVVWFATFSPDGKYIATASEDGTARLWNTSNCEEIFGLLHDDHVRDVSFSPDGRLLATRCENSIVYVWDTISGKNIAKIPHQNLIACIAFSPDGKYLATGSYDGSARLSDSITGNEIASIIHGGSVWSVAFSPDSKYLATASGDKTVKISNVIDGREVEIFPFNEQAIFVAFSPNGQYLAVACFDGMASLWRWQIIDPAKEACEHLTRNPSQMEWRSYLHDEVPYCKVCPNLP
jgi:WD40 repeat protein